jgi:uncharacterized membrane protein
VPYSAAVADASTEVACTADAAWSLLTAIERIPEWVPGVAEVAVLERDAAGGGLAVRAQFVTMPSTGSLVYRLRYAHDPAERTQKWSSLEGEERGVDGAARIVALADGRCSLHYTLSSWAGRAVPRWAHAALADDTAQRTVESFKRWAEAQPPGAAPNR